MPITADTTLCGLFGYPVAHSFSPKMHNAAFQDLNLNWVYLPFNVPPEHLKQAVAAVRALNLAGVNVTVPHKQAVLPYLDELTPAADAIGAVNVIINEKGKLIGDNTDGAGFTKALREETGFTPKGKCAVILGAGGAARAVAVQLAFEGIKEIAVVNRSLSRAENLAKTLLQRHNVKVSVLTFEQETILLEVLRGADLVVQATKVGMHPHVEQCLPIPDAALHKNQVVCDLIYNPVATKFLQLAKSAGAVTVNGLGMLLYQGVLAFELWTKTKAPVDVMREALTVQIGGRNA